MKILENKGRNDLAQLFTGIGAEVGVERAVFSKVIGKYSTKLYLIDPWQAYRGYREHVSQDKLDNFFKESVERMMGVNTVFIKAFSLDAVKDFEDESLDFVYIDANHSYENAKADIEAWSKKVKKGGIVAGHDYVRRKGQDHIFGVKQAVDELVGVDITIWKGDRSPSWSFVKQ